MKKIQSFLILCTILVTIGFSCAEETVNIGKHFYTEPYINPMIIKDLKTWISDNGDQVVAINLDDSVNSNRYFGEIKVKKGENETPFIYVNYEENEVFGYKYIGQTKTGIHLLQTKEYGDGSGVFTGIVFVKIENDLGFQYLEKERLIKNSGKRTLIKKLGEITLGDRYLGKISIKGNILYIGKDQNKFGNRAGRKDEYIKIQLK